LNTEAFHLIKSPQALIMLHHNGDSLRYVHGIFGGDSS